MTFFYILTRIASRFARSGAKAPAALFRKVPPRELLKNFDFVEEGGGAGWVA